MQAEKYGAKTLSSSQFADTLALIEQGRAEGTLNSREALLAYLKDNPKADLKYQVVPASKIPSAKIAGLLSKNNPGLKKKVNKAIKQLRADGTLKKLSDKYFTSNITEK